MTRPQRFSVSNPHQHWSAQACRHFNSLTSNPFLFNPKFYSNKPCPDQLSCNHPQEVLTSHRSPFITNFVFILLLFSLFRGGEGRLIHTTCWLGPPYHAPGLPGAAVRCVEIQLLQVPTGLWHCHATTQAPGWSLCASTCRHTSKALTWIGTAYSSNADKLIIAGRQKKDKK